MHNHDKYILQKEIRCGMHICMHQLNDNLFVLCVISIPLKNYDLQPKELPCMKSAKAFH